MYILTKNLTKFDQTLKNLITELTLYEEMKAFAS